MRKTTIYALFTLLICFLVSTVSAQYGNEWINYNRPYYKIEVSENGLYRIPHSVLGANGLENVPGSEFRLYLRGERVPLYVSNDGILQNGDFIEFVGRKNAGEFDRQLFEAPDDEQLNPRYSMFSDTSVYFLTFGDGSPSSTILSIPNDLNNPPDPEEWFMQSSEMVFNTVHLNPRIVTTISYSSYENGEGFASVQKTSHDLTLNLEGVVPSGPDAMLKLRYASANLVTHDIMTFVENDTVDRLLTGIVETHMVRDTLAAADLGPDLNIRVEDLGENGVLALAYAEITYPRNFDFSGQQVLHFRRTNGFLPQLYILKGFGHGGEAPVAVNITDRMRITTKLVGDDVHLVLPAGSENGEVYIYSAQTVKEVDQLGQYNFSDWSSHNTEYIILSHPFFTQGNNSVAAYSQYRSSAEGGAFNTRYYNINDIYDQFGYGIRRHPQAIRNFANFIYDNWPDAGNVLIIGKGIEYKVARNCTGKCAEWFFVPTYGLPGADNLLFAVDHPDLPFIPVGRIPAVTNEEVLLYLDKVKQHDQVPYLPQTIEGKGWTKNFLHLGGGATTDQQESIKSGLDLMAEVIESSSFGGNVTTFTKTSTNTSETPNSARILELLQEGLNVVQFFGHSSNSQLDFQINDPGDWNNTGKYPIFSAMGCSAGQIHGDYKSLSEIYTFEPNLGSVAFIAGSGSQFLNTLSFWGREWYRLIGTDIESVTLGQSVIRSLGSLGSAVYTQKILRQQQTITGDPALKFHPPLGRDYLWDRTSAHLAPSEISQQDSSYKLTIDLISLGLNIYDDVSVVIVQQKPDNTTDTIYSDKLYIDRFRTKLNIDLPVLPKSAGQNKLFITVDPFDAIEELPDPSAEENNTIVEGIPLIILDNRIIATYPEKYAIVTEEDPELIATSRNGFVEKQTYHLELDTTALFNSPDLITHSLESFGGIAKWQPQIEFEPSTVYYWRIRPDTAQTLGEFLWDASSFVYLPNDRNGWNQSHYYQLSGEDNALNGLQFVDRHLEFTDAYKNVWVKNEVVQDNGDEAAVFINNKRQAEFFSWFNTLEGNVFALILEPVTAKFWANPPGGIYGSVNGTGYTIRAFPFRTDIYEGRKSLIEFLENVVPSGHFVVLYTYQRNNEPDYFPELWENDFDSLGTDIFSVIEKQHPESEIRTLAGSGSLPYVIFYQKDVGLIREAIAPFYEATVNVEHNFQNRLEEGNMTSSLIGPASSWGEFQWAYNPSDNPAGDSTSVRLHRITSDFKDTLSTPFFSDPSVFIDSIDAETYPYMLLELYSNDDALRTSSDIDLWRVYFDGLPDLAINASLNFYFNDDTIPAGATAQLQTAIENISNVGATDFRVKIDWIDPFNNVSTYYTDEFSVDAKQSIPLNFETPKILLHGKHRLIIEVNPGTERPEAQIFNNLAYLDFFVRDDSRNPIMNVRIDNRQVMDGDIVSPTPVIEIKVSDDNPFLLLTDPDDIDIFLKSPTTGFVEIADDSPLRSFTPAVPPVNETRSWARAVYTPTLEDGFYTLRVQARDGSGNTSGDLFYEVSFEVLTESTVSPMTIYPNPARNYTIFEWTLSGQRLPESFSITIYDQSGRLVDEINPAGELYAGTHRIYYDLSGYPAGTYTYKMSWSGEDIRLKYKGTEKPDVGVFVVIN